MPSFPDNKRIFVAIFLQASLAIVDSVLSNVWFQSGLKVKTKLDEITITSIESGAIIVTAFDIDEGIVASIKFEAGIVSDNELTFNYKEL